VTHTSEFKEARRELRSILAPLEKRTLLWLASRTPAVINSDHLTSLGLAAMLAGGVCYALSRGNPAWLHAVNAALLLNWLGDSLDGTLARHRNKQRPRYGFYVDHIVDIFGAFFLLGGLSLSGYMSPWIALALMLAYYMLSINIYLVTYAVGVFKISFGIFGGTELRLLLALGNLLVLAYPHVSLLGRRILVFDVAGVLAVAGMSLVLLASVVSNTRRLYVMERV
jgi:archaetidylinositol phosphate synthase